MPKLFVIDANASWIRSLACAAPRKVDTLLYRIYSPQWLPNGKKDLLRCFRRRRLLPSVQETLVVVPGWNKAPRLSSWILQSALANALQQNSSQSALLFTFPFYSHVATWVKKRFSDTKIAYHAHDPFEFYGYPAGYIRRHEDRIVPLCDCVFGISERLCNDLRSRYPDARVATLGNAVSAEFLQSTEAVNAPAEMAAIRTSGSPLVGIVGQINTSYDWNLLETLALTSQKSQFVFIGNLFEEGEATNRIRRVLDRPNVHWLGPKPHNQLKEYMDACDVLLNPLLVNAQNDRRDSLRIYDYLSTKALVVSTPVSSVAQHGDLVQIADSSDAMVAILNTLPKQITTPCVERRREYLWRNTWECRAARLIEHLALFAEMRPAPRTVFVSG